MAGNITPAKSSKWSQAYFTPKNPEKYIGTYPIKARSSWELVFMNKCDTHPSIKQWASESIKIPYKNPVTGKNTVYIPDFLIHYVDKYGKTHVEVVEIKPIKQSMMEKARGTRAKMVVAVNMAKWKAAQAWCKKNGMTFRVMTEEKMFAQATGHPKS